MDKRDLHPDQVTLDLVLRYGTEVRMLCAAPPRLLVVARNHRGQSFQVMLEPHLDGQPEDGPPVRFVLFPLGPSVWKLSPSLTVPSVVHAYLTLVGVPEPAPWAT